MVVRTVTIKVFRADNKESFTHRTVAGKYKQFTAAGVREIVAQYAEKIEVIAPGQYRQIRTGPGEFTFVVKEPRQGD